MKILIFSDTHGRTDAMRDIISRNRLNVDLVIHLGDCLKDAEYVMRDFPEIAFLGVLGNCDFASMHPKAKYEGSFTAEKRRLFYTHGHKYNVNRDTSYLVSNAKFSDCNVALYGHTHIALCEEINGVYVINPGSLSSPRDNREQGTYAFVEINDDKISCKIIEVEE